MKTHVVASFPRVLVPGHARHVVGMACSPRHPINWQRAQAGARPSAAAAGTPLNALTCHIRGAPGRRARRRAIVQEHQPHRPDCAAPLRKTASPTAGPSATDALQAPMLAHCATGFNKTAEHKQAQTGVLESFERTTPVITCPKNPVLPLASLEVQILSENPEGSVKRIRYVCTYYPAVPLARERRPARVSTSRCGSGRLASSFGHSASQSRPCLTRGVPERFHHAALHALRARRRRCSSSRRRASVATLSARARIRSCTYCLGCPGTRENARLMSMKSFGSFISGPK